tara:strand:+ start:55 stop:801 length:747 start_codon:yes stop_codon:yes gene_type:complete
MSIKPLIVDNFFPEETLNKIDKFYKSAPLKLCSFEKPGAAKTLFIPLGLSDLISVFDYDSLIREHLKNYNPEAGVRHLERYYINVMLKNDEQTGHRDIIGLAEESFYISCLVFLNPHDNEQCGIHIGDTFYKNVYNRLIIFNGDTWHRVVPPIDDHVRITLYVNFTNRTDKEFGFRNSKETTYDRSNQMPNVYRTKEMLIMEERREKTDAQKKHEEKVFGEETLTPEEEELMKKKLAELRKRDPFIYR